ncbi:hypothetical protein [Lacrimispora sp.]|uniref:hypothetical protein n=1 Tax=Lacrimispora sp. TaxID=2719234 RepID=UPI002854E29D|nr:hypothetical protein [Lacrimispora sp.]MDR7814643.1 hypothetical protein [Lacrimispora sp.]
MAVVELDLGNVKGPQGEAGQRGSLWYNGTGITGTSTTATVFSGSGVTAALMNDYYQNTGTGADRGRVYRCTVAGAATVAKWVYAGTNLGPQGEQGIQGETGATGATGPKGDTGATGATGAKGDKGDKGDKGETGPAGPNAANLISATDVQGLVGAAGGSSTVQLLINAIADKVANKLLLKTDVVSQIVNDAAKAASMAALYSVNQKVDTVNINLGDKVDKSTLTVSQVDISQYKNAGIVGTTSLCYLQKYGKIAVVTIGTALLKYQAAGSNIVFTIPGYAPLLKTAIMVRGSNGNTYAGFAFGDNDMAIQIDNLPTGDLYIYGQFTVILK